MKKMRTVNLIKKLDKKTFEAITECVKVAELSGIKIYLVGGIVRDALLSKNINDVDITVEGNAKEFVEILECYASVKKVKYNENLPTAKVLFKNGVEIDFASTRAEVYEKFGDLPKIVKTGCPLKEDVVRRDFTVNAIAISLNSENLFEVIDYLDGVKDLERKKLRILHNKSFFDDPSRMIRGLKFAERLGFSLDEQTLNLQNEYLSNPLKNIPLERVKKELKDLFSLNTKAAYNDFIKQKLYKLVMSGEGEFVSSQKIKEQLFSFDVADEDLWLLYFLSLFSDGNPQEKLNLTARENKIISEMHEFLQNKPVFQDKFSIYSYFINKDYLSVVFYAMFVDEEVAKTFFKIRKTKINTTGYDLQNLGIKQGKIYSEIQKNVLKEKINNGLKDKNAEILFIKEKLLTGENDG